jgi:thioredoxin 1
MEVNAVGSSNFETEVVESNQLVIVHFWAEGCKPCAKLGKIVRQYADRFKVSTCNVDDEVEIVSDYAVRNVPSLLFFKNGQVVDQVLGYINDVSEAEVAAKCERLLSSDLNRL